MNGSLNLANGQFISTTDRCGREVLGMSGSLSQYIWTGNAGTIDTYQAKNSEPQVAPKKETKKDAFLKTVGKIALAGGAIFGIFKGRHKIASGAKSAFSFTKTKFLKVADFIESKLPSGKNIGKFIGDKFKKFGNFIESKLPSGADIKNFFGKIFKRKP